MNSPKKYKKKKDGTRIYEPNRELQQKIGYENLGNLIPDEIVGKAKEHLESNAEEFEAHLNKDLAEVRRLYEEFKKNPDANSETFKELEEGVLKIKSNAGMFNYQLATLLAWTLYNTIASVADGFDEKKDAIAEGLIKALVVVFQKRLTGDGGETGKALIEEVTQFIETTKAK